MACASSRRWSGPTWSGPSSVRSTAMSVRCACCAHWCRASNRLVARLWPACTSIASSTGPAHFARGPATPTHVAGRLVLAAGLGNRDLAPMVGLKAPVKPNRGQILVSERVQPFLRHPTAHVRQTGEGVVQIGDSKEDVGFDDGTTLEQLARIAAARHPLLPDAGQRQRRAHLGRSARDEPGRLSRSTRRRAIVPGAFVVTCHSGITLAAAHAGPLVDWMRGGAEPSDIHGFKAERFDVQADGTSGTRTAARHRDRSRGPARAGARGRDAGNRVAQRWRRAIPPRRRCRASRAHRCA